MTIAVHISLGDSPHDILSLYNYRCFSLMAAQHPDEHFIFIFDKPFDPGMIHSPNITPVLLGPALKNRLLRHYWYQYKLPRILSRYQADWYVNQDKMTCLKTGTRQMMILEDLAFAEKGHAVQAAERRYLRRFFPGFAQKADSMVVTNDYLKEYISKKWPGPSARVQTAPPIAPSSPATIPDKAQQEADTLTEGKSFFVFLSTALSNPSLIITLKAFSIFKKWQKSNMQMIILSEGPETQLPLNSLATYKYRHEVKIAAGADWNLRFALLKSAYAGIYLTDTEMPDSLSLEALSAGLPLICSAHPFQEARHAGAALYAAQTETSIAEKMMRLYKEENERAVLSRAATETSMRYTTEQAVSVLRDVLVGKKDLTFAVQ